MSTPSQPRPCDNCYYKATAGQMVDPCFPCLLTTSFSGESKQQFDHWVHESATAEELARRDQELSHAFDAVLRDNPDLRARLVELFGEPTTDSQQPTPPG